MIKNYELREDFIGIFYTSIDCQPFIDYFDRSDKAHSIIRRRNLNIQDDNLVTLDTSSHMLNFNKNVKLIADYNQLTSECMNLYVSKWTSVGNFNLQQAYMNIQKTSKSEGYHVWHHEDGAFGNNRRLFASMLYLNDLEEGGETEFLYQSLRIKPEKGKFVIWPAHWTHIHRGNPPLSGDKYIVTSWIENTEI